MYKARRMVAQKAIKRNFLLFSLGTVVALSLAWLGDQSYYLLFERDKLNLYATILSLGAFLIASAIITLYNFNYIKIVSLKAEAELDTAKLLILSVSPLSDRTRDGYQAFMLEIKQHQGVYKLFKGGKVQKTDDGKNLDIQFKGNLNQDIEMLEKLKKREKGSILVNWQQTLKALRSNMNTLEKVVLVYSQQMVENKVDDITEIQALKNFLSIYTSQAPNPCKVELHTHFVNKDKMDEYRVAFDQQIDKGVLDHKFAEKHIRLDITGGQVPASIGGSLATLHNNCVMQYVNNDGEVKVYDAYIKQVDAKQ